MERNKSALHFEPNEGDKFLRAIPLVYRLGGYSLDEAVYTVQHERDHIEETERLGHQNKIEGYVIKVKRKFKVGIGRFSFLFGKDEITTSVVYKGGIPNHDMIKIRMAPEIPSIQDFFSAMILLGFDREYKRLKERRCSCVEHKRDILDRVYTLPGHSI